MDYQLIALDLDGTLNNDQKVITPGTLDALMAANTPEDILAAEAAYPIEED